MIPAAVHRFAWGGTALVLGAVLLAAAASEGKSPWEGWEEGRDLRSPGYAERVRIDRPIRTRANTLSNLAYVTVGLYACVLALADRRRARQGGAPPAGTLVAHPALSALFGLACVWLGLASGLFHASLSRAGQRLDVAAMPLPLVAVLLVALIRILPRHLGPRGEGPATVPLLVALALVAEWALWRWKWSIPGMPVLAGAIGAVFVTAVLEQILLPRRFDARWLAAAVVLLVAAWACRESDVAGTFPVGPDAWLQGHAVWHVLTAGALMAIYLHERSERPAGVCS
jgi:hypothetical protein